MMSSLHVIMVSGWWTNNCLHYFIIFTRSKGVNIYLTLYETIYSYLFKKMVNMFKSAFIVNKSILSCVPYPSRFFEANGECSEGMYFGTVCMLVFKLCSNHYTKVRYLRERTERLHNLIYPVCIDCVLRMYGCVSVCVYMLSIFKEIN